MSETDTATLPCQAPGTPDPTPLREDVWRALMAVAGPEEAPWLARQVRADLIRLRSEIAQASTGRDPAALRAGSHSLAGLAGTIGAAALQNLAISLNLAVHDGLAAEQQSRTADVLAAIPPLLHDIESRIAATQANP